MTDAPDLLRLAIRLTHNTDCPAPNVIQITGTRDGSPGLLCRSCNRVWFPPARLIETMPSSIQTEQDGTGDIDDGWTFAPARPLVIPGSPPARSSGWPTHKARERARRR